MNLLTNAFKFGGGKPIEIAVEERGPIGRLVVVDHGIGIAPQDVERIFQRYEQAISSRAFGGLGSAYTLHARSSRHMVGQFGSKASLEPDRRSPSIFPRKPPIAKKPHAGKGVDPTHLKLPRNSGTLSAAGDGVDRRRQSVGAGVKKFERDEGPMAKLILIVEDDLDVAESVAGVLEAEGYQTAIAANGCEALDHLRRNNHPDLILLDVMMPVMDGWKFREEQRKLPALASIPVLTVTADGDARGKAASIQAAGHIAKPVEIDSLLDEVERICGLPDA